MYSVHKCISGQMSPLLHMQLPFIIRAVPKDRMLAMRLQLSLLWERYFSTVQSIVDTALEVRCEEVGLCICRWEVWRVGDCGGGGACGCDMRTGKGMV